MKRILLWVVLCLNMLLAKAQIQVNRDELRAHYDTLIPMMDGLFATRPKLIIQGKSDLEKEINGVDELFREEMYNSSANWGVIDSLGRVILPFQYHAVKQINANYGVAIIIDQARPLPTGLVRTEYHVRAFYFDRKGLLSETGKPYNLVVTGMEHDQEILFIIGVTPPLELPNPKRD